MIGTIAHKVLNASRFLTDGDLWMVIGGTAAWPDDNTPPAPAISETSVNTIIGAKKASGNLVVRDDINGTYSFLIGSTLTKWRILADIDEAIAEESSSVLIQSTILGDELPLVDFREVGVYRGLVKEAGVDSGKVALIPSEISDYGNLELIEYRKPVSRTATSGYTLISIINF